MRQFQRQRGQIGGLDLGGGKGRQRAVLALGPQLVTGPCGDAARTPGALGGLGAADPFGNEARHAGCRVKAGAPRKPCINDHADILDGQRCLGDGSGQHDLAALRHRGDSGALGGKGQRAIQRAHRAIGGQAVG